MSWHRDEPYQDLPPLPPAEDLSTVGIHQATIAAARALAKLDGACRRLPDPTMLVNLIPLMEAKVSCEIENIVTTNDELFQAANNSLPGETLEVKEVMRYRQALWSGYEELVQNGRPVAENMAIRVCEDVLGAQAVIRNRPGTYIGDPVTRTRIYTPPEGEAVIRSHLTAWANFIHDDSGFDPLVIMALAHYQFEAIHPFFDGNGRTGRVLNVLILLEAELLELPVLYLSGYIVAHKDTYYRLLRAVTEQARWEEWVIFMLKAVESTAAGALQLIEAIEDLRTKLEAEIRNHDPRLPADRLVRVLCAQPYVRIDNVVDAGLAQRQTASRWLNNLAVAGLLERKKSGRAVLFVNHRLLELVSEVKLS